MTKLYHAKLDISKTYTEWREHFAEFKTFDWDTFRLELTAVTEFWA